MDVLDGVPLDTLLNKRGGEWVSFMYEHVYILCMCCVCAVMTQQNPAVLCMCSYQCLTLYSYFLPSVIDSLKHDHIIPSTMYAFSFRRPCCQEDTLGLLLKTSLTYQDLSGIV